jgi:aspartyl-tRNA(Asn)/glutamyl-tRNA(Gln) amidotransferase subunit B
MGEVFAALNRDSKTIETMTLPAGHLAQLIDLILDDTISGKIAKDVFAKMWESGKEPGALVDELGLRQISDTGAIEKAIDDLLARDATKVAEYKAGKEQLFGYFVGQIMKAMQGKANPGVVNELLKKKLG